MHSVFVARIVWLAIGNLHLQWFLRSGAGHFSSTLFRRVYCRKAALRTAVKDDRGCGLEVAPTQRACRGEAGCVDAVERASAQNSGCASAGEIAIPSVNSKQADPTTFDQRIAPGTGVSPIIGNSWNCLIATTA